MDAVGMHVYSGAWSVGFARHFDVAAHLEEIERAGLATARANGWRVVTPPWDLKRFRGIDLAYANPPCVAWSTGGTRRGEADERSRWTGRVARALLEMGPTIAVMESVPRAWSPRGGRAAYERVARGFLDAGYAVTVWFTNALLHGAPQRRERFHMIAHRVALELPEPDCPHRTAGDALEGLPSARLYAPGEAVATDHCAPWPNERDMRLYSAALPDERLNDARDRIGPPCRRFSFMQRRVDASLPSRVMAGIYDHVHPTLPRILTLREGARLCGYPDDYVFVPPTPRSHRLRREDVSQAVMPCIGDYLGGAFVAAIRRGDEVCSALREIDWRPRGREVLKAMRG